MRVDGQVAYSSKFQLSQSFLLFVKPPRHPQVGSPVGKREGSDRVVFIKMNIVISINYVFGWRVCVLWLGGEMGGGSGFFPIML